ncbi:MAG: hypothetical protein KDC87_14590 [Planctomycetes bacterium]|nr:hypothetical protein [Planctomycetota bacterium]
MLRIALLLGAPLLLLSLIEGVWQLIGDPRIAANRAWLAAQPPHFRLSDRGMLRSDPDPEVAFTLRPGFDEVVGGNRYRVNELGLRGGPVAVPKPAGHKRVLVLGDSYAFGFGVAEKDTLAAQLQRALAAPHREVEVLNAGVPGYHTGQELQVLVRNGSKLAPDLVVLVYYANDNITPTFLYDPRLRIVYVDELPLPDWIKRVMARSILYSKLTKAYTAWLTHRGALDSRGERHWPTTRARLQAIAGWCRAQRIGLVLAAIPALDNSIDFINKTHVYNRDHDRLLTFAKGAGIAVADLRAVLLQRAKPIEDLFVSRKPPDSHLTGEGYRLLAAAVVEAIRGGGLLR